MGKKKIFPLVTFQVCGKTWTAYMCPTRWFNKKYSKDTIAITVCDDKEIFFRLKNTSHETIIHELMHAYFWESGMRSMNLNTEQLEELCCEIVSKHAKLITATAELVFLYKESM